HPVAAGTTARAITWLSASRARCNRRIARPDQQGSSAGPAGTAMNRMRRHIGETIMSDALYQKLKAVEPSGAQAYKAAVKGDEIDSSALRAILTKILDPKGPKASDISPDEAEALVLIIDSGELKPGTKNALLTVLLKDKGMEAVLNGTGVELKPDDPE